MSREHTSNASTFDEKDPSLFAENEVAFTNDLPPYSPANPPSQPQILPGLAHIDFAKYRIEGSTLSPDQTTITILSKELSSNPKALEAFLKEQIKLPPRPTVRITGAIQGPHLLFDLRLDFFRHISPSAEMNGAWAYTKVEGMDDSASPIKVDEKAALFSSEPDATGAGFWLRRFCADSAPVKKFIFKRTVSNWDTEYLAGQIRQMIISKGFRGAIDISFPVQRSVIVIQTPHPVNALVTGLRSMFVAPKKYEVLSVLWPYAKLPRNVEESFRGSRECMLQSEDAWWNEWKDAIMYAMASRRVGWVSGEDKVDVAMAGMAPKEL